ncbi:NACHT domain-containing protein [Streptomyces sp. GC420]|uniref:NACHT domain-containing protein n=1 Tax=Streptomyces sp. GC420 TaxID=2697568 RepID=UPI0014150D28|nr:NACHT domain-containing protein [Streptomyces sp. GC420]NBM14424.1 NACHT domain-containing protein [Streptomyces sp. GC420]
MSGVVPGARVRRAGIVYPTLLAVATAGALVAAPRLEDPASVLVALPPTWAGAYLAWSAYRADRADRAESVAARSPAEVADRLADAVRRQWEAEAVVRRLADPYPLPVAWRGADPGLAEASDPERLAGRDGEIADVFTRRVPARRLLVLGEPGSGKTLLLVRLVLALLERREADEPVPVLFPLASWEPAALDLRAWMERRLVQDHPELGAPAPDACGQVTLAGLLLERRLVLPVLDGFDELPPAVGALALHRVSEALPYGCGMVVSSRPAEYRAALRPRGAVPARPAELAGIHLQPLGAGEVADYLRRDAGGPGAAAAERWRAVSVDGRALLANDRRTLVTCVLAAAVVGAVIIGIQGWCAVLTGSTRVWGAEAAGPLWAFVVGLVPAVLTGLAIGIRQAAWGHYAVARCYLALRPGLPYDLMAFLADAHERGVLRRVGAVHQFRHIELQHRLAATHEHADDR